MLTRSPDLLQNPCVTTTLLRRLGIGGALLLLAAALGVVGYRWGFGKVHPAPLVISAETTYVTEPLLPDGTVDYAVVWRQRRGRSIPLDQNAIVPFLRAFGPVLLTDESTRARLLDAVGLGGLPVAGNYFVTLREHARVRGVKESSFKKAAGYPHLAAWLAENEAALRLVREGTLRAALSFDVAVSPGQTLDSVFPEIPWEPLGSAVDALEARSQLRLGAGDATGAMDDALTMLRLAGLAAREGRWIFYIAGFGVLERGCEVSIGIVASGRLSPDQLRQTRDALAALSFPQSPDGPLLLLHLGQMETNGRFALKVESLLGQGGREGGGVDLNRVSIELNSWRRRIEGLLEISDVETRLSAASSLLQEVNAAYQLAPSQARSFRRFLVGPWGRLEMVSRVIGLLFAQQQVESANRSLNAHQSALESLGSLQSAIEQAVSPRE